MSIHIVYGKPGSGKSLYGTRQIIRDIVETDKNIVTNFPLNVERLNQYLQEKYDDHFNLLNRLEILDDDNLREFFKFRGPESGNQQSVIYHLDEAQIPFNALDWAKTNKSGEREVFHYLTQHRKKGDDVWAYTQSPGNLDKQFRSLAQDFRRCENHRLKKLGVFRGMDKFKCHHFEFEATRKADAYMVEEYKLDPAGVASCYDTARGIGIKGNAADKGARAKGLTIGWGFAGMMALASLIFVIPWGLGKLSVYALSGRSSKQEEKIPAPAAPGVVQGNPAAPAAPDVIVPISERRKVRGYAIRGDRVRVLLDDGVTLSEDDDDGIESIRRNKIRVNGETLYLVPAADRPAQAPAVMPPPSASAVVAAPSVPPPPAASTEDRWVTHSDGVSRLKSRETLAESLGLR